MTAVVDSPAAPGFSAGVEAPPVVSPARLSNWRLFIFSLSGFPLALFAIPMGFFLPAFMTGELGLSLTTWAGIIFLSRVWDMSIDPMIGVACDVLPSRWGRRRHWLVIGAPILLLGIAMLCMPRFFITHMTAAYALGALIVMQVGTTIFGLNSQAWSAELSEDYHERSRILGWRSIIAGIAPAVAFGIPIAVERSIPHATNGDKLFYLAVVILILTPILTLLTVLAVPEAPSSVRPKPKQERLGFLKSWSLLLTNRNMLRIVVIDVVAAIPFSIAVSINFFYVAYVLKAPALQSTLLLLTFFSGFASMPIWLWLSKHFQKHKLLSFAYAMTAVLSCFNFLWHAGDVIPFAITTALMGVFASGPTFVLPSIVADVVDTDTLATGQQRTGTFYALISMTAKFAPTLAVAFVFPYLQWMGFDPSGHHNTPHSILALRYAFVLFSPGPLLFVSWLLFTFPLGEKEQKAVRQQIRETHG